MEKIQDAIAKARAARPDAATAAATANLGIDATIPPPVRSNGSTTTARITPGLPKVTQTQVQVAWGELPEFKPDPKHLTRNRVLTHGKSVQAAQNFIEEIGDFDLIRTRVLQLQKANGWKRIAVTAPTRGCGASTLTLNLALSLARQSDRKTILADLDMREPSLNRMLGISKRQDIAAVLEDKETFADHSSRIGETLAVSGACVRPRGGAEVLQSSTATRVLDRIEEKYEPSIMLFDLPPLLSSDDAAAFMGQVDAVILVAAAEQTTIKQIDACERQIADLTNPMGVVLTHCRYMDREG